jgi:hypothetical protein
LDQNAARCRFPAAGNALLTTGYPYLLDASTAADLGDMFPAAS